MPRLSLSASAEQAEPLAPGAELVDPPAPLSHGELDAALPGWLLTPPRPALPLPPRKALALAELAEGVDGPAAEFVDPPLPDEEGEVDVARLPAWMRGAPEHGPPVEPETQAASFGRLRRGGAGRQGRVAARVRLQGPGFGVISRGRLSLEVVSGGQRGRRLLGERGKYAG